METREVIRKVGIFLAAIPLAYLAGLVVLLVIFTLYTGNIWGSFSLAGTLLLWQLFILARKGYGWFFKNWGFSVIFCLAIMFSLAKGFLGDDLMTSFQGLSTGWTKKVSLESNKEEAGLISYLLAQGTPLYQKKSQRIVFEKRLEKQLLVRLLSGTEENAGIKYRKVKFPIIQNGQWQEGIFDSSSQEFWVEASSVGSNLVDLEKERKQAEARAKAEAEAKERADAEAKEKIRQQAEREVAEAKAKAKADAEKEAKKIEAERKAQALILSLSPTMASSGPYKIFNLPNSVNYGDSFEFLEAVPLFGQGGGSIFVGGSSVGSFPSVIPAGFKFKIPGEALKKGDCFEIAIFNSNPQNINQIKLKKKGGT